MGIKNWTLTDHGEEDGDWAHETGRAEVIYGVDDKDKHVWRATVQDADGGLVGAKVFTSRIDGMLWCEKQLAALAAKQAA
jgi:hypothetical protein